MPWGLQTSLRARVAGPNQEVLRERTRRNVGTLTHQPPRSTASPDFPARCERHQEGRTGFDDHLAHHSGLSPPLRMPKKPRDAVYHTSGNASSLARSDDEPRIVVFEARLCCAPHSYFLGIEHQPPLRRPNCAGSAFVRQPWSITPPEQLKQTRASFTGPCVTGRLLSIGVLVPVARSRPRASTLLRVSRRKVAL